MQRGPKAVKENIINNLVNLLHAYRQKCAAQSSPSQLILPENLKLLPLYTLTALKTPGFKLLQGCKLDEKISWLYKIMRMPISQVPYFFYPRIYRVSDIGQDVRHLNFLTKQGCTWGQYADDATLMTKPQCFPATLEKLDSQNAYLLDNADYLYLYLGNQVSDSFIYNVIKVCALI